MPYHPSNLQQQYSNDSIGWGDSSAELPPISRRAPKGSPKLQARCDTATDSDRQVSSSGGFNPLNEDGPPLRNWSSVESHPGGSRPEQERRSTNDRQEPPPVANSARPRRPRSPQPSNPPINVTNQSARRRNDVSAPQTGTAASQSFVPILGGPTDPRASLALRPGPLSSPFTPPSLDANSYMNAPPPFYTSGTSASASPSGFAPSAGLAPGRTTRAPTSPAAYDEFSREYSVPGGSPGPSGYRYPTHLSINTGPGTYDVAGQPRSPQLSMPPETQVRRTFRERSFGSTLGQSPYLHPDHASPHQGRGLSSVSPGSSYRAGDDYFGPRSPVGSPLSPLNSAYAASVGRPPYSPNSPLSDRERQPYARYGSQRSGSGSKGSGSNFSGSQVSNGTVVPADRRPSGGSGNAYEGDDLQEQRQARKKEMDVWASGMMGRMGGYSQALKEYMRTTFENDPQIQDDRRSAGWSRRDAGDYFDENTRRPMSRAFEKAYTDAVSDTRKEFIDRVIVPSRDVEFTPSLEVWRRDDRVGDHGPLGFGVVASCGLRLSGLEYDVSPSKQDFGYPPRRSGSERSRVTTLGSGTGGGRGREPRYRERQPSRRPESARSEATTTGSSRVRDDETGRKYRR